MLLQSCMESFSFAHVGVAAPNTTVGSGDGEAMNAGAAGRVEEAGTTIDDAATTTDGPL